MAVKTEPGLQTCVFTKAPLAKVVLFVCQISICRGGPAAGSLPTPVVDVRILIALDRYCVKFRFVGQAIVGWGHVNYGVIATGNHWICYAALCNSPTDQVQ